MPIRDCEGHEPSSSRSTPEAHALVCRVWSDWASAIAGRYGYVHQVWVLLSAGLVGEVDFPELRVGQVLHRTGLRLPCTSFVPAVGDGENGLRAVGEVFDGDNTYRLQGQVVATWRQAAVMDTGVGLLLLQPSTSRPVRTAVGHEGMKLYSPEFTEIDLGAAYAAVGRPMVVRHYEWDAFYPLDLRRDWLLTDALLVDHRGQPSIQPTKRLDARTERDPHLHYLVDLEPVDNPAPPAAPEAEPPADRSIQAVVRDWFPEEGWGIVDSPHTPGGCWVHFSRVQSRGLRELVPGESVALEFEHADQHGFHYRAVTARPR